MREILKNQHPQKRKANYLFIRIHLFNIHIYVFKYFIMHFMGCESSLSWRLNWNGIIIRRAGGRFKLFHIQFFFYYTVYVMLCCGVVIKLAKVPPTYSSTYFLHHYMYWVLYTILVVEYFIRMCIEFYVVLCININIFVFIFSFHPFFTTPLFFC